jgi:hypothetical protein
VLRSHTIQNDAAAAALRATFVSFHLRNTEKLIYILISYLLTPPLFI